MHEDLTEEEEMKRQRKMKIMKDLTMKIRSRGRMYAANRCWVAELLAADCEKAWLHPGEEETMQKMVCLVGAKGKRKMKKVRWKKCFNKG